MARASSSPWLCLPLLLLAIAAVFVALPVAACAGSSNDAGNGAGSGRKRVFETKKELLGQKGAPSQRRAEITLPYSCGGCTWSITNGVLSMAGVSDCGSGCPATLDFWHLSITSVDAGAFNSTGLQNVTELFLNHNELTSLPSGIFDKLTGLTYLYLDRNHLTSLPSGIFDKLTALDSLGLWSNHLTSLPSGIFDQLTALTYLGLFGNQLTSLPSGIFDKLTGQTELYLDVADTWACSVTIPVAIPLGPFDMMLGEYAEFNISTYNALPPCRQLSVTQGLESDACVNETRTMQAIISGGRDGSSGFFRGGLGGKAQGNWRTYGCWRRHACLDSLNSAGIDTTGDAICYKFNSAQHTWLLWGLQSSLNLQCSSDHGPGVGGEGEHGELWGFPLTAPRVKYVSNYSFPLAELNRTLTPIAGYDAGVAKFTTIDISGKISIDNKYRGGVLCPNGKVALVPLNADHIGMFDPSDRSFTTIDISGKISIDNKYRGGVLCPNGKVIFPPYNANNIGVLDPSNFDFSTIDISDEFLVFVEYKYAGGVLATNGKVYFVPHVADHIGVFDPSDATFSTIDISHKISNIVGKYYGGVLGPDGKIVFIPHRAGNVGIFDPSDESFTTVDVPVVSESPEYSPYIGGVLGPNGKIFMVPFDATKIGVYDPSTASFSTIPTPIPGGRKYSGGVLGPNGKIIFVPDDADNIGIFDPSDDTFTTMDISDSGRQKYLGGVLGSNGNIIFVPMHADNIGILELGNKDLAYEVSGDTPEAWTSLLSPHFNKF